MIETDPQLEQQLIAHEGLKLKPYRCTAGKLTIGVGRNLDDVGLTDLELRIIRKRNPAWQIGDAITRDEAMLLLRNDIVRARGGARTVVSHFDGLSTARQRVLIDMVFNLGLRRFVKFKGLLGALVVGDYARAAEEMLDSKWARQVGKRATTLAAMMSTDGRMPQAQDAQERQMRQG